VARYRNTVRWVLSGYAALTTFLWMLLGVRTPIGYIDRAIEIALILLLLPEGRFPSNLDFTLQRSYAHPPPSREQGGERHACAGAEE
jgi:hypothetical protein